MPRARVEGTWPGLTPTRTSRSPSASSCSPGNLRGEKLMTNARHLRGSAWLNFQRIKCEQWSHFNGRAHVVLMGDAVHTAHFAIGSGTKLALEDAIELTLAVQAARRQRRPHPRGAGALSGGARSRRGAAAERGVERDGVVRGVRRALLRPARTRTVHVLDADAQPAHQPRKPAPARQGLARGLRALVRRQGRPASASWQCHRCSRRSARAPSR